MLTFSKIPQQNSNTAIAIEQRSNNFSLSDKALRGYFSHYSHLGAFENNQLRAFVIFQTVLDEAEIIHLVCDIDYQGKGIAKQLMCELIQQQKQLGITVWHLEVRESNMAAIELYQNLGFEVVGRRKAYYQNGEDALLMRL